MACASSWNRRMYNEKVGRGPGASSPFWPSAAPFEGGRYNPGWWTLGKMGLVAMVLGFIVFWPIGLAILAYNFFRRKGWDLPITTPPGQYFWSRPATGNSAFEDWRRTEIERIERERQKLAEAEREFAGFLDELKKVKDREEFDRFMNSRKGFEAPDAGPAPEPAR